MDRRDPFAEMNRMLDEMRRTMGQGGTIDRGEFARPFGTGGRSLPAEDGSAVVGLPRLESSMSSSTSLRGDANVTIESTDEGYLVLADVPGFEKSEIDVRLDGETLVITADRDVSQESETGVTRRRRSVHERIAIPVDVLEAEVSATYRNGVLEVVLPTTGSDEDSTSIDVE